MTVTFSERGDMQGAHAFNVDDTHLQLVRFFEGSALVPGGTSQTTTVTTVANIGAVNIAENFVLGGTRESLTDPWTITAGTLVRDFQSESFSDGSFRVYRALNYWRIYTFQLVNGQIQLVAQVRNRPAQTVYYKLWNGTFS